MHPSGLPGNAELPTDANSSPYPLAKCGNSKIPMRSLVLAMSALYLVCIVVDIENFSINKLGVRCTSIKGKSTNMLWSSRDPSWTFPSVDERVEYYMGDWYHHRRTCQNYIQYHRSQTNVEVAFNSSRTENLEIAFENEDVIALDFIAPRFREWPAASVMPFWLDSAMSQIDLQEFKYSPVALPFLVQSAPSTVKLNGRMHLPRFADQRVADPNLPELLEEPATCDQIDSPPILWNLWGSKLLKPLYRIAKKSNASSWEQKGDRLSFRMYNTGDDEQQKRQRQFNDLYSKHPLVDSKMMPQEKRLASAERLDVLRNALIRNKAVIVVDDPLALTGALYSNSVVLMPWPPRRRSWLIEEKMQPWEHFVPVHDNFSDVIERLQWVLDNPSEASRIQRQATEWIKNIYLSDSSFLNNRKTTDKIVAAYQDFFEQEPVEKSSFYGSSPKHTNDIFHAGGRPESKILSKSLKPIIQDESHNISTAVCYKAIFGDVDLHYFIRWAAYQHLLGFDHIFMWYMPSIRFYDGFRILQDLPYVTMIESKGTRVEEIHRGYEQSSDALGVNIQLPLERDCLENVAKGYDWVTFADADEFLWFNESIGVKQFLSQYPDYTYLSFGKVMYDRNHGIDIPDAGFGLDMYPFTAGSFCYPEGPNDEDVRGSRVCPKHHGRAKVIVRPTHWSDIQVHGFIDPDPSNHTKHFDTQTAHYKEWAHVFEPINTKIMPAQDFVVPSDLKLSSHHGGYKSNPDGSLTVHFDNELHDWFEYVAARPVLGRTVTESDT